MPSLPRTPSRVSNTDGKECTAYPTFKLGQVTRVKNLILPHLNFNGEVRIETVRELVETYDKNVLVYERDFNKFIGNEQNFDRNEIDSYNRRFTSAMRDHNTFRKQISDWMNGHLEPEVTPDDSISNVSSKKSRASKASIGSNASVASQIRFKLAEEKAKLEAESYFQEQKTRLAEGIRIREVEREAEERERRRIGEEEAREEERQVKELEMQQQRRYIANMEDHMEGLSIASKYDQKSEIRGTQSVRQGTIQNGLHTNKRAYNNPTDMLHREAETMYQLIKIQERAALPKNEPPRFSGADIVEYKSFRSAFKILIENHCDNPEELYYYLEQYTSGEAQQIVRSCRGGKGPNSYMSALAMLDREYGNEHLTVKAYLKRLSEWPDIDSDEGKKFKELSIFLTSCSNLIKSLRISNQFDSESNIIKILQKLPYKYMDKWRLHHYNLAKTKTVTFQDFVAFLQVQSEIINQPVYGDLQHHRRSSGNKRILTTQAEIIPLDQSGGQYTSQAEVSTPTMLRPKCEYCTGNNHGLKHCFSFRRRDKDSKIEFLKSKGLCFGCLLPGHSSRMCRRRLTCEVCHRNHPTVLHIQDISLQHQPRLNPAATQALSPETTSIPGDSIQDREQNTTRSFLIGPQIGAVGKHACAAVPVKIRLNKGIIVETYAGLDGFATDCFMNANLLNQLGVKGHAGTISLTTMESSGTEVAAKLIHNLEIMDLEENNTATISTVYCRENWPFDSADSPNQDDLHGLDYLNEVPFVYIHREIGLLVGMNYPDLMKPLEIIDGPPGMPYASLHKFGWALNGPIIGKNRAEIHCYRTKIEDSLHNKLDDLCCQEFEDRDGDLQGPSLEDEKWRKIVEGSIKKIHGGHFEIELPFKNKLPSMPENKGQALACLRSLKQRLLSRKELQQDYQEFMNEMVTLDFAERVPENEYVKGGKLWYITHHGVYHKQKKKIRVVFNCSLKFQGVSLNDCLLQGPDLTSNLLGVLLRFREEPFATMSDIRKMFYMVKLPGEHSNYLRYFWYPEGDLQAHPQEFRLRVHVFGAVSSPAIANFALRYTAETSDPTVYSQQSRDVVRRNFYVDDLLYSSKSEQEASATLKEIKTMLSDGGFHLTSFVSNSREILNSFPDELSKGLQHIDLLREELPHDRALGVAWNVEEDRIGFKLTISETGKTKRAILSAIHSIYDPFGIINPAILPAKRIFQAACHRKIGWDEELPADLLAKWSGWMKSIDILSNYSVPRCFKLSEFYNNAELHIFCDGSLVAYAATAYLCFQSDSGTWFCSLVMSKSRLVPMSRSTFTTIPRIELNAARLGVKVKAILTRELGMDIKAEYFWSDSATVLKYLYNDSRRFQRFVANRVAFIRANSHSSQWRYVPGELNPADIASRGASMADFMRMDLWKYGPKFLWRKESWPDPLIPAAVLDEDPEVIKTRSFLTKAETNHTLILLESSSSWLTTKLRVAYMLRVKHGLKTGSWQVGKLSVDEIVSAEKSIWAFIQKTAFTSTMFNINARILSKKDPLTKLAPILGDDNLMRVGGRINRAVTTYDVKHPIILPNKYHVVKLMVADVHRRNGHLGREFILSQLRQHFWIVGVRKLVKEITRECIICRRIQGRPGEQMMAALPKERVTADKPPFSEIGVDCFGPFSIKRKRTSEKRYGVIFTCLASRAAHIEIIHSMDTSSFIDALRRFLCRRGNVKTIISDNGSNFVGANKELLEATKAWNSTKLDHWLHQHEIQWKFNPPGASHFGGVYEREIRTIRKVFTALMNEQAIRLTDESLNTLFCEVENILNSRPITAISDDPSDIEPLTPNHLLHGYAEVSLPPGIFQPRDIYAKRRWKQVQYLTDLFWTRWKREYLPILQERQKWTVPKASFEVGDLVLLVEQSSSRNDWPLGRITNVFPDKEGKVRMVDVKVSRPGPTSGLTVIRRPICKIILLRSVEH